MKNDQNNKKAVKAKYSEIEITISKQLYYGS